MRFPVVDLDKVSHSFEVDGKAAVYNLRRIYLQCLTIELSFSLICVSQRLLYFLLRQRRPAWYTYWNANHAKGHLEDSRAQADDSMSVHVCQSKAKLWVRESTCGSQSALQYWSNQQAVSICDLILTICLN